MKFKAKMSERNVVNSEVDSIKLWHERFGHIHLQTMEDTEKSGAVKGLIISHNSDFFSVKHVFWQHKHVNFISQNNKKTL